MKSSVMGLVCAIGLATAGVAGGQNPAAAGAQSHPHPGGPDGPPSGAEVTAGPADIGQCGRLKPSALRGPLFRDRRPLTTNDIMQSYVGDPAPKIVSRWGAATTTYENRDGSRILTWRDEWSGCTQTVLVDSQDIVSRWRYSGCRCVQDRRGPPKATPIPPMTL